MPTENKPAEPIPSLASGADLNAATWTDFVERLRYDCKGPRVDDHCTSGAIFIVEERKIICGLDTDYTDKKLVYFNSGESVCYSPTEYWQNCDRDQKRKLNQLMQDECGVQFMKAREWQQWDVLDGLPEHTVTGWVDHWDYVNAHFTHAAAEAFIQRKKHDYRDGLRIYVDSQYWCWEFEAIKAAILDGTLTYDASPSYCPPKG
ncbi:hypothetical protein [Pseudomonas sp. GL-RE-26]|jgi:hypothetical protein|uniref:hypothetical protein n=1 Tax=Pseudomonas sp. GL-RE-26 TaxID=2832390 RepID=UPI001CBCA188|nr:hypothetical protein [Pseudomonas sp. GL-RE-26]